MANKPNSKNKKYFLACILIGLALAGAFIYKSGGVIPALEKIASVTGAIDGTKTPEENKIKLQGDIIDRAITKLKEEGKNNGRILVNAGGGLGSEGSGASSRECAQQITKLGDSNYFVRIKITGQESAIDGDSGQALTYLYADVDEYEKITGTTVRIDNETGTIMTDTNLTEEEYLEAGALIPDLNPEKLMIVAVQDSGNPSQKINEFSNIYLTYSNNVFSKIC